jgi:hypothetical protein
VVRWRKQRRCRATESKESPNLQDWPLLPSRLSRGYQFAVSAATARFQQSDCISNLSLLRNVDRTSRFTAAPTRLLTSQHSTSMDDKEHVFARFKDDKPAAPDRRQMLNIPRRGGAMASRAVEVVHVRSNAAPMGKSQLRRLTFTYRAATCENGFPARPPAQLPAKVDPKPPARAEPVTQVMPMWEPTAVEETTQVRDEAPVAAAVSAMAASHLRTHKSVRRVADPFAASDNGANCMRNGYAIEPAREKLGLLTCSVHA